MAKDVLDRLQNIEAPPVKAATIGVKLSKITTKLKDAVDIVPLLGKFQQLGLVKIVYNPSVDEEPLVQITEKGKMQAMELLLSLQPAGK
jgi:hypothetical protein